MASTPHNTGLEAFEIEQAILSSRSEIYDEEEYTPLVQFEGWTELFPAQVTPFQIGEYLHLI